MIDSFGPGSDHHVRSNSIILISRSVNAIGAILACGASQYKHPLLLSILPIDIRGSEHALSTPLRLPTTEYTSTPQFDIRGSEHALSTPLRSPTTEYTSTPPVDIRGSEHALSTPLRSPTTEYTSTPPVDIRGNPHAPDASLRSPRRGQNEAAIRAERLQVAQNWKYRNGTSDVGQKITTITAITTPARPRGPVDRRARRSSSPPQR